MAHERAIKEAKKALDLGYSENEAAKLLKARGMDKDEIKKEFPAIKAQKMVEDAKKKSPLGIFLIIVFIVLIAILLYLLFPNTIDLSNFISFN